MSVCLYAGEFGLKVAERLAQRSTCKLVDVVNDHDALAEVQPERPTFVALWRPYPRICDKVDEKSFLIKAPVVYGYMDQRWLQVGPLTVPGASACFRCFYRRAKSHSVVLERDLALERAYDADPQLGLAGYVGAHTEMMASLMTDFLQRSDAMRGRIIRIDLVNGSIVDGEVVAIHACDRCRQLKTSSLERFSQPLKEALTGLIQ